MEVEIVPRPNARDEALVTAALERVHSEALRPFGSTADGRWLRAALAEGVEREPEVALYALSPRSKRGASRA